MKRTNIDFVPNPVFRSYNGGWVLNYNQDLLHGRLPSAGISVAEEAVDALGLDFGAVDLATRTGTKDIVVWEVNTAPGLEGPELPAWGRAFARVYETKGK